MVKYVEILFSLLCGYNPSLFKRNDLKQLNVHTQTHTYAQRARERERCSVLTWSKKKQLILTLVIVWPLKLKSTILPYKYQANTLTL